MTYPFTDGGTSSTHHPGRRPCGRRYTDRRGGLRCGYALFPPGEGRGEGDTQLSKAAKSSILNPGNTTLVSPASYWEIAIKIRLGKYMLHEPYEAFMQRGIFGNGLSILLIEPKHTAVLTTLPLHHRDPFDRLLVAQAMVEQMPLVSGDPVLDAYEIARIW